MTDYKLPLKTIKIVKGVAGSGKTTYIQDAMIDIMEQDPDAQILFLTFGRSLTNKSRAEFTEAIEEAYQYDHATREKMLRRFKCYTIHSYCLRLIGAWARRNRKEDNYFQVVKDYVLQKNMEARGWTISNMNLLPDYERIKMTEESDKLFQCYSFARSIRLTDDEVNDILPNNINLSRYKHFVSDLKESKRVIEKKIEEFTQEEYEGETIYVDFEDIIETAIEQGYEDMDDSWDYIFIDEAQDLNPLMSDFIYDILIHRCANMIVLGDASQSIHGFRGANAKFIDTFGKSVSTREDYDGAEPVVEYRNITYRCSKQITNLANRVKERHKFSEDPRMIPHRKEEGLVSYHNSIFDIRFFPTERYFILAKANHYLEGLEEHLMKHDISFAYSPNVKQGELGRFIHAYNLISAMSKQTQTKRYGIKDVEAICRFSNEYDMNWYGQHKERLEKTMKSNGFYKLSLEDIGMDLSLGWDVLLRNAPPEYLAYVKKCIDTNQSFSYESASVILMTIHAVKGMQCDNVVLITDITQDMATTMNYSEDFWESWHVGITRARDNLMITKRYQPSPTRKYVELY